MVMAAEWQVSAILTDKPLVSLSLATRLSTPESRLATFRELGLNTWTFPWLNKRYWNVYHTARAKEELDELIRDGGPLENVERMPPLEGLEGYLEGLRRKEGGLKGSRTRVEVRLVPEVVEDGAGVETMRVEGVRA